VSRQISGLSRTLQSEPREWKPVRYVIFDAPKVKGALLCSCSCFFTAFSVADRKPMHQLIRTDTSYAAVERGASRALLRAIGAAQLECVPAHAGGC